MSDDHHFAPDERAHEAQAEAVDLLAIEASPPRMRAGEMWVASCLDAHHPVLAGRALCSIERPEGATELWLPVLHGLAIRAGDQLLVTEPANYAEPIVVGVVDGYARRPETPYSAAAKLALLRDESLVIESQAGQPLVELYQADEGPVVRLLQDDVHLELRGELRISAKAIALSAREGEARVAASSDVVVVGESIRLN